MDRLIVVLGKSFSTALGIIRPLYEAGNTVDLFYIAHKKGDSKIAASSKCVRKSFEHVGRNDKEIIEQIISMYGNMDIPCLLFPTDDYTSLLIDTYRDVLKDEFLMPYVEGHKAGAISNLMNKYVQYNIAGNFDLNLAKTWNINLDCDDFNISDEMIYPCFCKPETSAKGFKSEMLKCNNKEELVQHLKHLQRRMRNRNIVVQEFLFIDEEFSLPGICLGDAIILPSFSRKLYVGNKVKGVTMVGQVCEFGEYEPVKNEIVKMLRSLNYHGMVDIDLIRCKDKIYLSEINFRSSGIGYSVVASGLNIPDIFAKHMFGDEFFINYDNFRYNLKFLYEQVAWKDYIADIITKEQFETYKNMVDVYLILNDNDPQPGILFEKRMTRMKDKKILKAAIKKRIPKSYEFAKKMMGRA